MIQILIGALALIIIGILFDFAYERGLHAAFDRASRTARQWGESDLTAEQRRRLDEPR